MCDLEGAEPQIGCVREDLAVLVVVDLTTLERFLEPTAPLERTVGGEFRQPFRASDDYGVIGGQAEIALDLARVDRRYGFEIDPEPRDPIVLDLPLTITGDRRDFEETLIDDLAQNPWACLPIKLPR